MTVSIQDAATKAINLGKQLKAVIDVGEVLQELGGLEQARSEAKRHSMEADAIRVEAQKLLQEVGQELQTEQERLHAAKAEAQQVVKEANVTSARLVADAQKTATETLASATVEANAQIDAMTASVQTLEHKRTALVSEVAQLHAAYTKLKSRMRALHEKTRVED